MTNIIYTHVVFTKKKMVEQVVRYVGLKQKSKMDGDEFMRVAWGTSCGR